MNFVHRLNPLVSRLRPRLGLPNGYKICANRSWVLSSGIETTAPPAIFDPAELRKVSGVGPDCSIASEFKRAQGGTVSHGATMAYEMRQAVISRGHLFTRQVYYPISAERAPVFAKTVAREYSDAVLATSSIGIKYFGHWMADDLPKHLAAKDIGHPVSVLVNPNAAQRDFLHLLDLQVDTVANAYFERMVVIDDVGQNAYKRERFERLRKMAQAHGSPTPAYGVMLLRGEAGVRRVLVNENEVAAIARARGFQVIDPLRTDAAELMRACVGAKVILGVEGSQLTNGMLWMSPTGTVVTIQPPQRLNLVLKDFCDCIGVRYAFVIGDQRSQDDFYVDTSALQRLLDRVK